MLGAMSTLTLMGGQEHIEKLEKEQGLHGDALEVMEVRWRPVAAMQQRALAAQPQSVERKLAGIFQAYMACLVANFLLIIALYEAQARNQQNGRPTSRVVLRPIICGAYHLEEKDGAWSRATWGEMCGDAIVGGADKSASVGHDAAAAAGKVKLPLQLLGSVSNSITNEAIILVDALSRAERAVFSAYDKCGYDDPNEVEPEDMLALLATDSDLLKKYPDAVGSIAEATLICLKRTCKNEQENCLSWLFRVFNGSKGGGSDSWWEERWCILPHTRTQSKDVCSSPCHPPSL
jgi:hypothetical protein